MAIIGVMKLSMTEVMLTTGDRDDQSDLDLTRNRSTPGSVFQSVMVAAIPSSDGDGDDDYTRQRLCEVDGDDDDDDE